jgi:hypothetical protein
MPYLNNLPIMPKEARSNMSYSAASTTAPYPQPNAVAQRNAAIWSTSDDEVLLRARASGLNWQPIASRNFPNKTANACRKRHERLIERRHVDDWDNQKLELLAQEYLACRKEMWEMLAARLGERWSVVEAKVSANEPLTTNRSRLNTQSQCMEKGVKLLQSTARTAQRKALADHHAQAYCVEDRGISDHNSDSGIVLCSGSEPDMEATDEIGDSLPVSVSRHGASASWSESYNRQQERLHQEHLRSRSLPLPLPQYQPPMPVSRAGKAHGDVTVARAPTASNLGAISYGHSAYALQRYSPETQQRLSIQAVLSPEQPSSPRTSHCETTTYDRDAQNRRLR